MGPYPMNDARRDVALFRYSLIREPAYPALTTRQRGALVRALAAEDQPSARAAVRSNGPTEGVNNPIAVFGFRSFDNYRIRSLLYADKPDWSLLATVTPY
ncbi:MAG: hypothetical protein ACRDVP_05460 [Acidimicrobiales bacterium]